jgi:methylmalonyl-CoA/ethylmalonyl-CoA epimerase
MSAMTPVPKLKLHHTGLLVKDVAPAAQHYAEVLGYRMESEPIDDPVQTARVQFLRLPGATHWLELIAPLGPESKLANALTKGGGLHHLCYEVADLGAATEYFRIAGCMVISEPVVAVAFPGRRIAWLMDRQRFLFELLEAGPGPLALSTLPAP